VTGEKGLSDAVSVVGLEIRLGCHGVAHGPVSAEVQRNFINGLALLSQAQAEQGCAETGDQPNSVRPLS
jgi:hypothetical protein